MCPKTSNGRNVLQRTHGRLQDFSVPLENTIFTSRIRSFQCQEGSLDRFRTADARSVSGTPGHKVRTEPDALEKLRIAHQVIQRLDKVVTLQETYYFLS